MKVGGERFKRWPCLLEKKDHTLNKLLHPNYLFDI